MYPESVWRSGGKEGGGGAPIRPPCISSSASDTLKIHQDTSLYMKHNVSLSQTTRYENTFQNTSGYAKIQYFRKIHQNTSGYIRILIEGEKNQIGETPQTPCAPVRLLMHATPFDRFL